MVNLNIERINANSPYNVCYGADVDAVKFTTDFGVDYNVSFLKDDFLQTTDSYQLIITNVNNKKSPRDAKLRQTILAIIYEFFESLTPALFYFCDTFDDKQSQRNRLFAYWFNSSPRIKDYISMRATIPEEDGVMNFTAIIVRIDNPRLESILAEYTETIKLLSQKPCCVSD